MSPKKIVSYLDCSVAKLTTARVITDRETLFIPRTDVAIMIFWVCALRFVTIAKEKKH